MGRVPKPTSQFEPSGGRGGEGILATSIIPARALSLPGASVRVGVDLPLPEAPYEGLEPGCLKWCP